MRPNVRPYAPRQHHLANRENRRSAKDRVNKNAFGMWRPLTEVSRKKVEAAMRLGKTSVLNYLESERPAGNYSEFIVAGEKTRNGEARLGVTFVEVQKVRASMRQGGHIMQALNAGRLLSEIETHTSAQDVSLEIPLGGFMWCGHGLRKLVGVIENGEARQELVREAGVIEQILTDVNRRPIHVQVPDHVTVAQYGSRRDGQPLSVLQRNEIEIMMQEQFTKDGIGSVALGAVIFNEQDPWSVKNGGNT